VKIANEPAQAAGGGNAVATPEALAGENTYTYSDTGGPEAGVIAKVDLSAAWGRLSPEEQENLSLIAWEELTAPISVTNGRIRDDGNFGVLQGVVGPDVAGVVINTPFNGPITATVADGRFVAWWPETAGFELSDDPITLEDFLRQMEEHRKETADGLSSLVSSVTITLHDGTILANQPIYVSTYLTPNSEWEPYAGS